MVWIYTKKDIFGRKRPVKKYKNGHPNVDYFAKGMACMRKKPTMNKSTKFAEIYPTAELEIDAKLTVASCTTRSIELWKEPDSDLVRIILCTDEKDMSFFADSINIKDYEFIDQIEPKGMPKDPIRIDAELSFQINFSSFDIDKVNIIEELVRVISNMEYAHVQFLFTCDERINKICTDHIHYLENRIKKIKTGKIERNFGIDSHYIPIVHEKKVNTDLESSNTEKDILQEYNARENKNLCALALRLRCSRDDADVHYNAIESVFHNLQIKNDHIEINSYHDGMFDEHIKCKTLLNDESLDALASNANMWKNLQWGKGRDYVPFLCITDVELAKICAMPYAKSLPLKFRRKRTDSPQPPRIGLSFSIDKKTPNETIKYGKMVKAKSNNIVFNPDDLLQHVYLLGATGCGKTTLLQNLIKHIEALEDYATFIIDNKDRGGFDLLKKMIGDTTIFLDINETNFGINLLELPEHNRADRDLVVSFMVDHIISLLKSYYSQSQTYIQLERLLKLLLQLLYANIDSPTMRELYRLIDVFRKDGGVEKVLNTYEIPTPEFALALRSAANLRGESWVPLINRIETFVTDSYKVKHFGVRHTTFKFSKFMEPGTTVIIRVSDTQTPEDAHRMVLMSLVAKLWFAIKKRASDTEYQKRIPVILVLDEFQRIGDMEMLRVMLSQARSFRLGVVLAHQNTDQIDKHTLESIMSNCATQIYGRTSGTDASRVESMTDPSYAGQMKNNLAGMADFTFFIKQKSIGGSLLGTPAFLNALPPPPDIIDDAKITHMLQKSIQMYGIKESYENMEYGQVFGGNIRWKTCIDVRHLFHMELKVIRCIGDDQCRLLDITKCTNAMKRDDVTSVLNTLIGQGFVMIESNPDVKHSSLYCLTKKALNAYIHLDYTKIGSAKETPIVAEMAAKYYRKKGWFVCIANQTSQNRHYRPDLVAYDYRTDSAISVEIESRTEVESHPEHVRFNMKKWRDLGFSKCHVWSASHSITKCRDGLDEDASRVEIFIVKLPSGYERKKYVYKKSKSALKEK
ncbi:MAG: ATPase [Cenarchaeum symbiont of Oopsacas minuta]|nr:ATPase [Cenarchaeum symbiont of Oopsacas minuta]